MAHSMSALPSKAGRTGSYPPATKACRSVVQSFHCCRAPATGTLQRNYFFEVRDGDFQRGIN